MGLFSRTPSEIKQLEQEIIAAKVAVGMASKLDDDHRRKVIETAQNEVAQAARAARAGGHLDEARLALEKRATPPTDPVGAEVWPGVIEAGLKALS